MAMDLTGRIIGAESSGNPFARNPRSSAGGLGQFIDSTWLATVKKHRPDLAAGRSDGELLRMKFNPAPSREMTAAYAADNQGYLKSRGVDPTPGNTYLAHFAGPQGAAAIHADPSQPVERLLGARAVAANPFLRGKTGADVINWAAGKVGDKGGAMPAASITGAPVAAPVAGTTGTLGALPDFGPLPPERKKRMAQMLMEGYLNTANRATNPLGAVSAMVQAGVGSYLGGQYDEAKKARDRKLAEALMGAKTDDELQRTLLASGDDDLIKAAISQRVAAAKPVAPELTEIYDEQGRRQKVLINPRTGEYKLVGGPAIGREEADELSLNPIQRSYQGKRQIGQVSKRGGIKWTDVEGEILSGLEKVDTGTEVQLRDKRTGQVVTTQQKDIAGEAREKEVGKAKGEALGEAPKVRAQIDSSLSGLDRLAAEAKAVRDSAGLEAATGLTSYLPNWPGGEAASTDARLKTLKSQIAFSVLQAMRDASKSGGALGAVSEKELALLENNIAGLDTAQSMPAFQAALDRIIAYSGDAKGRLLRAYQDTYGREYAPGGAPATDAALARGGQSTPPATNMSDDDLRKALGL
jgi:hypothetical protein